MLDRHSMKFYLDTSVYKLFYVTPHKTTNKNEGDQTFKVDLPYLHASLTKLWTCVSMNKTSHATYLKFMQQLPRQNKMKKNQT